MLVIDISPKCCSNFNKKKRERRLEKDRDKYNEKSKSKRDLEIALFVTENSRSSNLLRLIAKTNSVRIALLISIIAD